MSWVVNNNNHKGLINQIFRVPQYLLEFKEHIWFFDNKFNLSVWMSVEHQEVK